MPWHIAHDIAGCSGWAVVKDADGKIVGCHTTRQAALRQLAALNANVQTRRSSFMAEVDNSNWDAGRAMRECKTAADYAKICAGKRSGDPSLRASWALPHHYLSKAPTPNAGGVRAALQRLSGTQGLTNAGAARTHLEGHMRAINPDYQASLTDETHFLAKVPVEEWEIRHTGRPDETFTVRGYAAVFDQLSHDMGGFRTKIDPAALDEVLATNPDVHFVWDHDTRYVGARTSNETLSLQTDDHGLFMDAQVGAYSWAKDLKLALERGDIDQGSIALTIADDSWDIDDDDNITRTVLQADGLYDVTVTAQGAFPQTNLAVAYSLLRSAVAAGRLPERVGAVPVAQITDWGQTSTTTSNVPVVIGGGQPSQTGGNPEVVRRASELRNQFAVQRDEIDRLLERVKAL